jgi:hypothetical protein
MDAINYSSAFGAGGVNPMQAFNQSLALGSNIMQQRAAAAQAEAQRIAAQAEAERQAKLAEMMGTLDSPDATSDDYRRVATYMDPEQAKVMKDFYDSMAEEERETALSEYGQVLSAFEGGRADVGIELLKMQAKAAPDEKSRAYGNMLVQMAESGELGIDAIKKTINTHLSFMPGGDKVLTSVQQAQKAPLDIKKLIADTELTDAQKKEALARAAKLEIETQNLLKEEGGVVPPEKVAAAEDGLRKELYSTNSLFRTIDAKYEIVKNAEDTGIGDIGLIYSIMTMYDPNSAVKEGEAATAQSAAGVPSWIVGMYNKAVGGGVLDPKARSDIKKAAESVWKTTKEKADANTKLIEDIARRRGLNLANIRTPPKEVTEKPTSDISGLRASIKAANPGAKANIDNMTEEQLQTSFPNGYKAYKAKQQSGSGQPPQEVRGGSQ